MGKPLIIGVISQKGGVGKTTVAVNLAVALRMRDYKVLLIDGDTSNPSIGIDLGMEDENRGYKELVATNAPLDKLASIHGASGLHVITGTLHTRPFIPLRSQVSRLEKKLRKSSYDFIVIDSPPGYHNDDEFGFWDEAVIVSTPDMPAITACLRLEQTLSKAKVKHSLVLNMVRGRRYELRQDEIQDAFSCKIAGVLPADDAVNSALAERIPVFLSNKGASFSKAMGRLSSRYGKGTGISRIFRVK
ncbi:MAG: MinD/ParA family protein [Candidatus Micrarchaeota archaeon]|nr:MinD/ParA family protein [Candidatus Micrarchaeota archaeon]